MCENPQVEVNGKILFGVDFLNIMRWMELPDENEEFDQEKQEVVDTVAMFLLAQWDFNIEEIDKADKLFWEKVNSESSNEIIIKVVERIVGFLEGSKNDQEKFFVNLATVALMDSTYINHERIMMEEFQKRFDFRPSEVDAIYEKGWSWSRGFDILGDTYVKLAQKNQ